MGFVIKIFLSCTVKTLAMGKQVRDRMSTISQINITNRPPINNCYLKAFQVEENKVLLSFAELSLQN